MIDRQWGPSHSPEYQPIMAGIIIVCALGFLCSIFPVLEIALSIFIMILIAMALIGGLHFLYKQYRLDQEVLHGDLGDLNEKEETK